VQKPEPERTYPALREQTETAYDQIADRYAAANAMIPARVIELGMRFLSYLPPAARVLDVGCGPGYHMAWMEAQGFHVTGIDLSNEMLNQARLHVRGELMQMDMCWLTLPPASFEGIWCCASFFHLPKNQALTALSQMQRVLIPGGMLYLSILEGQDETWKEEARFAGVLRFFAHYTPPEIEALLTQAGFSVVERWRDVADSAHTWLNFLVRKEVQETSNR
jgi:ubiquinone/menaquinone biosynthesis C-methylase UbiE